MQTMSPPKPSMRRTDSTREVFIAQDSRLFSEEARERVLGRLGEFKMTLREEVSKHPNKYKNIELAKHYLRQGMGQKAESEQKDLSPCANVQTLIVLLHLRNFSSGSCEDSWGYQIDDEKM